MPADTEKDNLERYWQQRTLCSDETCIGVIGPDGRCKECGKPYLPGENAAVGQEQNPVAPENDPPRDAAVADPVAGDSPADDDEYWQKRTLCSDETCIGVIGPDGRCKECGKPYNLPKP